MNKLPVTAQNVMDLYYQTYKSDEDFFELMHFKYLVSIMYGSLMQREYEKSYAKNLAEFGKGEATLNDAWFIEEDVDVVSCDDIADYCANIRCAPFQFTFDKQGMGIKDIIPLNGKCKEFIRLSFQERWKLKLLPPSPEVYWFPLGNKIYFANVFCGLRKAKIIYAPEVNYENDDSVIPNGIEAEIVRSVMALMTEAKSGKVIDVVANNNPNAVLQTEINNIVSKMRT